MDRVEIILRIEDTGENLRRLLLEKRPFSKIVLYGVEHITVTPLSPNFFALKASQGFGIE